MFRVLVGGTEDQLFFSRIDMFGHRVDNSPIVCTPSGDHHFEIKIVRLSGRSGECLCGQDRSNRYFFERNDCVIAVMLGPERW